MEWASAGRKNATWWIVCRSPDLWATQVVANADWIPARATLGRNDDATVCHL